MWGNGYFAHHVAGPENSTSPPSLEQIEALNLGFGYDS